MAIKTLDDYQNYLVSRYGSDDISSTLNLDKDLTALVSQQVRMNNPHIAKYLINYVQACHYCHQDYRNYCKQVGSHVLEDTKVELTLKRQTELVPLEVAMAFIDVSSRVLDTDKLQEFIQQIIISVKPSLWKAMNSLPQLS